jgi:pyruvate formate lyase activating enzyme
MKGMVFDIQAYSLYDGPGIRTAVYLKGCPLRCWWCHNPESQRGEPEYMERAGKRERIGAEMTVDEVLAKVLADRAFFEHSGGGVTLSGGEPGYQPAFATALLRRLREEKIHTAMETCGLFSTEVLTEFLDLVDLFLFDIKHLDAEAHRQGTRGDNRQILKNFVAILEQAGPARVTARLPLIPGFNTDLHAVVATLRFLAEHGYEGDIHLMPHHGWARGKYEGLGRTGDYRDAGDVPANLLANIETLAADHGFKAVIYG